MDKRIFTFWAGEMPDYIKLCIDSWRKYLPDFEIVVLNFENLDEYIGKDFYDKSLYENFTIAQQTQAIRAAVLFKHGGLWFDADIIVTSDEFLKFFDDNSELHIFSNRIACIKAKKGAKILNKWIRGIKRNVWIYKHFFDFIFEHYPFWASDMMNWDYLSDRILNKYYKTKNKKLLNNIDISVSCVYPETNWNKDFNRRMKFTPVDIYNLFYIKNNNYEFVQKNNKGLIILHNSWMPREYQKISKKELFAKNNTLADILKNI